MKKLLPYILIFVFLLIAGGFYIDSTDSGENVGERLAKNITELDKTEKVEFKNYGPAPEFTGITNWLNGKPQTLEELRGKVVLVDFWTYSCINCIRTLPYVTKWYDTYRDKGFVVVGVHAPEFAFEKVTSNVKTALARHKINYPVAQDNDFMTWRAYGNQYWPAKYLINQQGNIVYTHFGEGDYDITERAIQQLLGVDQAITSPEEQAQSKSQPSPEMYFGFDREEYMAQNYARSSAPQQFNWLTGQEINQYQLEGTWAIEAEKAVLKSSNGRIRLRYNGSEVHMVASSPNGSTLKIFVNNKEQTPVTVNTSQLYTLFQEDQSTEHELIIEITGAGFEAFTFTFG